MSNLSATRFVQEALAESRAFFERNGLARLAAELPENIEPGKRRRDAVQAARRDGFEVAFMFPPLQRQAANIRSVIKRMAATALKGLDRDEQYAEPRIEDADALETYGSRNRPESCYLLLYRPDGWPSDTAGESPARLRERFAQSGWRSLTHVEYLILQRLACERHGDHRFDLLDDSGRNGQGMWLLDADCGQGVLTAGWSPQGRAVELAVKEADEPLGSRGAHPTALVEIP